ALKAEHVNEVQAERLDDRRVRLRGGSHLQAGRAGISPFDAVGLRLLDQLSARRLVEFGTRGRADRARAAGQRPGARLGGKACAKAGQTGAAASPVATISGMQREALLMENVSREAAHSARRLLSRPSSYC